jgi:hypothetical protein
MRNVTKDRRPPASAAGLVEELTPKSNLPAEHYTNKIIMNVFGKRYELTCRVEAREITKGPAQVVEMPRRQAIEL